jgi:hypothetical protein
LLLVAAAVVVYLGFVEPHAMEEHAVTLQLEGSAHEITRIDTSWTGIDPHEGETVGGGSLYFKPGQAPREVRTTVHAPSGTYWLEVTVSRGPVQSASRRRISLKGDAEVFVPVNGR